jgi:hypothetical protein
MVKPSAGGGGGLDQNKLHAAGFGETDPVVSNATDDGRKQNRRVELVVLPDVSEMLDLGAMATEAEKPKPAAKAPAPAAAPAPAPAAPAPAPAKK